MCNWLFSEKIQIGAAGTAAARGALSQRVSGQRVMAKAALAMIAGGMLAAGPVQAQTNPYQAAAAAADENTFEVTPFIGYMAGGKFEDPTDISERDVQSDTNWGLFLNLNADSPERQYEMFYTKQGTTVEGAIPIDMDIEYLQIGGIVNFTDVEHAIPYFGITVGGTQLSPDGPGLDSETKFSFTVGTGVKVPITKHIGLRFDARAFVTLLSSDANLFCVSGSTGGTCRITAKSDTFVQYALGLGVVAAF